ncbi:SMI1/KNR4 family protein [Streptomyces sp. NPDC059153]|uniref:SMI1/KNR4 family protein n=1 Tax=unclassified Streptomyces TaxID=2593676 RepID=UPI0036C4C825
MDEQELLAAVHTLVAHNRQDVVCGRAGHGADHACLLADEVVDLSALGKELSAQYGRLRNLAMGGYVDPTVTGRTGAPLLAPFGDQVVEMRAWKHADWWIGCGAVRADGVVRPVVLVAGQAVQQQPDAEAAPRQPGTQVETSQQQQAAKAVPKEQPYGPTEETSWVDQVVAVTGWTRERGGAAVDWARVESRLGTVLPGDYKELIERFGYGDFDDYLGLLVPDGPPGSLDLVEFNEFWARAAAEDGGGPWEPYRLYPAPGGLLQWASTEQRTSFYWLTEGADPDRWPILVTGDDYTEWDRFDSSTGEFIHCLLTDPQHPYSTACYFDRHWFTSYENPDGEDG